MDLQSTSLHKDILLPKYQPEDQELELKTVQKILECF